MTSSRPSQTSFLTVQVDGERPFGGVRHGTEAELAVEVHGGVRGFDAEAHPLESSLTRLVERPTHELPPTG